MTTGNDLPHAHNLRTGSIPEGYAAYFLTKCTFDRAPLLSSPEAAEIIIDGLAHQRRIGAIRLLAFVVMPDHFHAVACLMPNFDLSDVMQRMNSFTANQLIRLLKHEGPIWQPDGFYDRKCRDDQEVIDLVEYVHHNPVRRGLVAKAEDWLFSSAHPSRRALLDWEWWRG